MPTKAKLPNSWQLFIGSIRQIKLHWKLFAGITAVYLVLTLILVKGLAGSTDVSALKESLQEILKGNIGQLAAGLAVFGVLLGSANSASSDVAAAYQSMILIITSLVLIWALRQTVAGNKVGVKESFYKGVYPLIPFVLVMIVVGIQLLPLISANFLYGIVFGGGLAVTILEKSLWIILFFLLVLWSLYMVTSSLFGLYIATLPDVTPLNALRSARELVRHRRFTVLRKILFLPFILILLAAIIMVPVIILISPLAEWLFLVLTMFSLAIIHSYMYKLYRELL